MSDWKKIKLGDIAERIQTGPFGSQLHQTDYAETGIPVVMPKDIRDGRVVEDSIARIEDGMANKLARHKVIKDDIIYPRRGDIAKCAIIQEGQEGFGQLCCVFSSVNQRKCVSLHT